jgi:hypothetical protein
MMLAFIAVEVPLLKLMVTVSVTVEVGIAR